MALDQVANFIRGNAAESVDNSQTTISVNNASIFPDPSSGEYNVVIWDADSFPRPDQDASVEILRITAYDTGNDTITVNRGQEGTSAASHPNGSAIHLSPTAKMFSDIESNYVAEGENFDGQSTSEFNNLASVDTGEINTTRHAETVAEAGQIIADTTVNIGNADQGGLKITLPSGVLSPDAADLPLTLKEGFVIEGQGNKATQIEPPAGYAGNVIEYDASGEGKAATRVVLRDLSIFGDGTAGSVGVYLNNAHKWRIEGCKINGFGVNLDARASFNGEVVSSIISGSVSDNVSLSKTSDAATNGIVFLGGNIQNAGVNGIFAQQVNGLHIYGTRIEKSAEYGVRTTTSSAIDIEAYFESNGRSLDRDGDGNIESAQIGLSPDPDTDSRSFAVDISGSQIALASGNARDVGVKIGEVTGVEISGSDFLGGGEAQQHAIEVAGGGFNEQVRISESNSYRNIAQPVVEPLSGISIDPQHINNGEWATPVFGGYSALEPLANTINKDQADGFTVLFPMDVSSSGRTVQGGSFPPGTVFKATGNRSVTLSSDGANFGDAAIRLTQPAQVAEGFDLSQTGGGAAVYSDAAGTEVRDCTVSAAGDDGLRLDADGQLAMNVICESGSIGGDDIQVGGENVRVVACDAAINDTSTNGVTTAGNVNTA